MIDEFIKLFSGLQENFGKADMSKVEFDEERNKIKPHYMWAQESVTPFHYKTTFRRKNINRNSTLY